MEATGLALGILGPLQQTKQLIDGVKRKLRAYRGNSALLDQTIQEYETVIAVTAEFRSRLTVINLASPNPESVQLMEKNRTDCERYQAELNELMRIRRESRSVGRLERFRKSEQWREMINEKKEYVQVADRNSRMAQTQQMVVTGQRKTETIMTEIMREMNKMDVKINALFTGFASRGMGRSGFKIWWTIPRHMRIYTNAVVPTEHCARCKGRERAHPYSMQRNGDGTISVRYSVKRRVRKKKTGVRLLSWLEGEQDEYGECMEINMQVKEKEANVCDKCIGEKYNHRFIEAPKLSGGVHYVQLGKGMGVREIRAQLAEAVRITGGAPEAAAVSAAENVSVCVARTMCWFAGKHVDFRVLCESGWELEAVEKRRTVYTVLKRLEECSDYSSVRQRPLFIQGVNRVNEKLVYKPFRSATRLSVDWEQQV